MTWLSKAVCSQDGHSERWLSYNLLDIEYAKSGCAKCTMHKQCLTNAFNADSDVVVGVIAGVSEYERLIIKFQKDR